MLGFPLAFKSHLVSHLSHCNLISALNLCQTDAMFLFYFRETFDKFFKAQDQTSIRVT